MRHRLLWTRVSIRDRCDNCGCRVYLVRLLAELVWAHRSGSLMCKRGSEQSVEWATVSGVERYKSMPR